MQVFHCGAACDALLIEDAYRALSQDFSWGGGGRFSRTGTKYLINDTPCMQVATTPSTECRTYELTEIGATLNGSGGFSERQRREPLGGNGGVLPQKTSKSEGLKKPFPALSERWLCQKGS